MRAQDCFKVIPAKLGGTVLLQAKENVEFVLCGSSIPASENSGAGGLHNLFLHAPEDFSSGLVVVQATKDYRHKYTQAREGAARYDFFIRVFQKDGIVYLDLEEPWVPSAGILPHLIVEKFGGFKNLGVQVGQEIFTTDPNGAEIGRRVLKDNNIICQFLAGNISLDDLRAAAAEVIRQKNLDERHHALQSQYRDLQMKLEEMGDLSLQLDYVQSLLTIAEGEKEDLAEKLKTRTEAYDEISKELRTANKKLARISDMTRNPAVALWNWTDIRWIFEQPDDKDQG